MGLGLLSVAGLAAAVLDITHHIIVKTGLFLVAGVVEAEYGGGGLDRTGGLLHRRPVVALLLPLAVSLAGSGRSAASLPNWRSFRKVWRWDRGRSSR